MGVLQYDTASGNPTVALPKIGEFAGYISGRFNNYQAIRAARPRAQVLAILTRPPIPGELHGYRQVCFDVENGDITPAQIRECIRIAQADGIPCPVVYGSGDTWTEPGGLNEQLAGLERDIDWQGWLADPDGDATVPAGFAAKQYLFGPEYDTTLVADPDTFYNLAAPTPPEPPEGTTMVATYKTADNRVGIVAETNGGEVFHIEQQHPPGHGDSDFWRNKDGSPNWLSLGTPGK
jgi:hypothetical protein